MNAGHRINSPHDSDKDIGKLLLPIRKDDLSKLRDEATGETPYDDGDFAVLEVDEKGYLRVKLPTEGAAISSAPTLEASLSELCSLMRRVVFAIENFTGAEVPDPRE